MTGQYDKSSQGLTHPLFRPEPTYLSKALPTT
jgi:hypothetical protein